MRDLFDDRADGQTRNESLGVGAVLLRGFCVDVEEEVLAALRQVADAAPFRRMTTPGGYIMSAAMTNCGSAGWVTDRAGYRYDAKDPESGKRWPAMPPVFLDLAMRAAAEAGFEGFLPDACLINRYEPGAKLSLHQDKDERAFDSPIVSVSLGLPATFLFGGLRRRDPQQRVPLRHGDIAVWGGPSRLAYHGVMPLKDGEHPTVGRRRLNLTLRKAL
ncbi:DNA oxidative demethylase AlkB [Rhodospirillaceae bacterium SYSU D60014]|uniref:DNA oxidative demethylase AlkB n=1 Tax=Virgifigura deserti TaxID=2268457 RepID=UPI000E660968